MTTINVSAVALKAALFFAATKDIRYYLKGVLVQATPDETRIVAMDGYMAGAWREDRQNDVHGLVELIIPGEVISGIKVPASKIAALKLELDVLDNGMVRMRLPGGLTQEFKPIEGVYPDYPRVIPTHEYSHAVDPARFDIALLERIGKAMALWTGSGTRVMRWRLVMGERKDSCARIETDQNGFVGAIMPLRDTPDDWCAPQTWAKSQPTVAAEKQAA